MRAVTELYRCLLNDTIALAQALDHVKVAIMCPAFDAEELSLAVADTIPVVPQTGNGLAAALDSVFEQFATVGRPAVIAFNSDSPHLPASVLQTAFDVLETCDLVIGPTQDGGYYLVGARSSHRRLFTRDGMGTTTALAALLERASNLQLSARLIDSFYDIDVAADLSQLAGDLELAPQRAPRTAAWLVEWRRALAEHRSGIGTP
jgi:glycosyltransferase A (GT-A) superfamily protein (DUF2064 family)